jgi:hypothetical protein
MNATSLQIVSLIMLVVNCISTTLLVQTITSLRKTKRLTPRKFGQLLMGILIEVTCASIALLPLQFDYIVIWGVLRIIGRILEIIYIQTFLSYLRTGIDKTKAPVENEL